MFKLLLFVTLISCSQSEKAPSFNLGYKTNASGDYSTAMGMATEASGTASTSMGVETAALHQVSTAMGIKTVASGMGSTAMGFETVASGMGSVSLGIGTISSGDYSTVVGKYNNKNNNTIFTVGNGTTDTMRSDAFRVYFDGKIEGNASAMNVGNTTVHKLLQRIEILEKKIFRLDYVLCNIYNICVILNKD